MKKMFYSEVLNKYFDDEKECRKAELQYQLDKQAKEKEEAAKKQAEEQAKTELEAKKKEELAAVSKEKKALSDEISKAEDSLTSAQNEYQLACEKYREERARLKEEYFKALAEAEKPVTEKANLVKKAQQDRYAAVKNFNDKYGAYTVKYTGDRAYKEMQKTIEYMNNIFDKFWF